MTFMKDFKVNAGEKTPNSDMKSIRCDISIATPAYYYCYYLHFYC